MPNNNYHKYQTKQNNSKDIKDKCCENPQIEDNGSNLVCLNCGMTFGRTFVNLERRVFTENEKNDRKQNEPIWREIGARTIIPQSKQDGKGNSLSKNNKQLYSRLSKVQKSLVNSIERNFWDAHPQLKAVCAELNIPKFIRETAWIIYKECAKKKLTMGRSIIGFVAASLYAAIRIHEFPKVLDEISEASMIPTRKVHKALGLIVDEVLPKLGLSYKPVTIEQLIVKFGNELEMPVQVQNNAINLLKKAQSNGFSCNGKDPKGIAGSVLYYIGKIIVGENYKKTQKEVAKIAKITEVTLRNRCKELKKCV